MSTLAFIIANDAPEDTDPEWFGRCTAWITGTWMAWSKLQGSLNPAPKQVWFDSPNLTSNAADYMGYRRPEDSEAQHKYVQAKIEEWQKNGCPDVVYGNSAGDFVATSGLASKLGVAKLRGHRGMQELPGKHRTFIKQEADLHQFNILSDDVELGLLQELVRAYGGHALGLWNFGHCLNVVHHGPEGSHHFRLRLNQPGRCLKALKEALKGSPLEPDWKALELPHWELSKVFQAFGIKGALDLIPKEGPQLWAQLDSVGTALLHGQVPDAATLKAFNATLKKFSKEPPLPSKPAKGMARKVFSVAVSLQRLVGLSNAPAPWPERFRAANSYWDLSDGAAADHWTVGLDSKGVGVSASLGRLLTYYPQALRRDAIFWSLAAWQAEAANGHAYVAAMECLAENAAQVGMTVGLIPAAQIAKFRKAAGIEAVFEEALVQENGWCAEVFLDLPGLLKGKPIELLQKHKSLILRIEADGSWQNHSDPLPGQPDPSEFGRQLDPAGLLRAAGFKELFQPAQTEATRASSNQKIHSKEVTQQAVSRLPAPQTGDWTEIFPPYLDKVSGGRVVHLRIQVNTQEPEAFQALSADLARALSAQTWVQGSTILLSAQDGLGRERLHSVLGDLPSGSEIGAVYGTASVHVKVS
jgi:hypothetical protein